MQSEFVYRGRKVRAEEIEFIGQLIAAHPGLSRRRLSAKLCAAWNWVQPNGQPRDMVARSLMLELHRAGHIQLPVQRFCPLNNAARHRAPARQLVLASAPLECSLAQLGPLDIHQVRRTPAEKLFGSLLEGHHYLGYTQPVGEHLKYLIYAHFASHLLVRVARRIAADWQSLYAHPVYLLETFIDPERFGGTCYRAANWIYLGLTTGRGKDDQTNRANRSLKQLWVYPLRADFRRPLQGHG